MSLNFVGELNCKCEVMAVSSQTYQVFQTNQTNYVKKSVGMEYMRRYLKV